MVDVGAVPTEPSGERAKVVTTFAVQPDGTVGTAPTSTTKSRLHYEKPEVAKNRQEGIKYF